MDKKVRVYIEIEKDSNQKFEYNHEKKTLELDRVLKEPFVYPFPYGFVMNTKAKDNDELDILILTNEKIMKDTYHDVFIVGVLVMEDENGMDEKVLCVFEEDYKVINDITNVSEDIKEKIRYFFTNYKINTDGRWSKVYGYEDKSFAIKLYEDSLLK
jgi:inorganic pyrophosphatase